MSFEILVTVAPKVEKIRERSETKREEKRTLISNFWMGEALTMRNLQSMFSPRDPEELLSTLDPSIREMCMEGWEARNPPIGWG